MRLKKNIPTSHYNTILHQIISIIPRHIFDRQAVQHHSGQKFRSYNRWSQFMAAAFWEKKFSDNLKVQFHRLYHLGMKETTRATLARVNRDQPASLYETIFYYLLKQCQDIALCHKFSFKNKVYLLDATVIDLCLALFPWAKYRKKRSREAAFWSRCRRISS